MAVSVALHGALALAIAFEFASSQGTPSPVHRNVAATSIYFVPSASLPDAAAAMHARQSDRARAVAALVEAGHSAAFQPGSLSVPQPVGGKSGSPSAAMASPTDASSEHKDGSAQSSYETLLRAYLRPYFVYPDAARPERLGGIVQLHLVVGRNGQVLSEWVQGSSGFAVLDASALDLVHRAQPLPPLPAGLPDTLEIALPLQYTPPKLLLGAG